MYCLRRLIHYFLPACTCDCLLHVLLWHRAIQYKHPHQTVQQCLRGYLEYFELLNRIDFAHNHVIKLLISRLIMIPAARMNSMTARTRPLRRSRLLRDSSSSPGLTAGPPASQSTSFTVSVPALSCESPGSSGCGPGHTTYKHI